MANLINPTSLNISRDIIKNSQLQFVPSLLKERQFNDTVKGLTIFVDKKNKNGEYENIFIRDEGKVLTKISDSSSTIFAKSGYVSRNEDTLVLLNGNMQKIEKNGSINIIKFKKTEINLSGLCTNTISEAKLQETPTINLVSKDEDCDLNYTPNKSINKEVNIAMSNSFGFGGHNGVLVFSKE